MEQQPKRPTFELIDKPYAGIRCLRCGMLSYNRQDIEQRYCGSCHRFHTPAPPPAAKPQTPTPWPGASPNKRNDEPPRHPGVANKQRRKGG